MKHDKNSEVGQVCLGTGKHKRGDSQTKVSNRYLYLRDEYGNKNNNTKSIRTTTNLLHTSSTYLVVHHLLPIQRINTTPLTKPQPYSQLNPTLTRPSLRGRITSHTHKPSRLEARAVRRTPQPYSKSQKNMPSFEYGG